MSGFTKIAPSILSADFRCLQDDIRRAEAAGADYIHCDVMDGHFVPNITFGPLLVDAVRKSTSLPLDVHLMISNPEKYIERFRQAGADILTVHAETCKDLPAVIQQIRASGARVGIAANPDQPLELLVPYLNQVDMVLLMTVFAGFGGQEFIAESLARIQTVRDLLNRQGLVVDLEVDGGMNTETAARVRAHGANVIVAGSFIFKSNDYKDRIAKLRGI